MTPNQMQSHMLEIGRAAQAHDPRELIFATREALNAAYRAGFEDGVQTGYCEQFVLEHLTETAHKETTDGSP